MSISSKLLAIYILIVVFFHSALFLAPSLQISGNFEVSKILISHIILGGLIPYFLLKKKITYNSWFIVFGVLVIISTIFSPSPFISFFGDTNRGHGMLFFIEMLFLFFIFLHLEKQEIKNIVTYVLWGSFGVGLWIIKEYYFPSFDYGVLSSRAIGTFGHPSFLACFFLLLTPHIFEKVFNHKKYAYTPLIPLFIGVLFLSKQNFGCFLFILYTIYFFSSQKLKYVSKKKQFYILCISIIVLAVGGYAIYQYLLLHPEKIHSGLSRIYIWKTVGDIIISSPKIFILGNGPETLSYFFSSFKDPHLYIFENFGYTADRAHNIFLDTWYNFGIIGVSLIISACIYLIKNFKKNPYFEACIIFFIFNSLNFPSITGYILFLLFFAKILKDHPYNFTTHKRPIRIFFSLVFVLTGINASFIYAAERQYFQENIQIAKNIFPYPKYYLETGDFNKSLAIEKIPSIAYLQTKIFYDNSKISDCNELVKRYPAVENYFFCGKIFERLADINRAKNYYSLGVEKLPDLWNKDSKYWKKYFVKNTITGNRFFSDKYSKINYILSLLKIQKTK